MAFSPFANFRKYQKIWMAIILLVCMLTFVLCTGAQQGDLGDWLLRIFRPGGTVYASIDGGKVRAQEFTDLKVGRNIANEFMRKAAKYSTARMDEVLKPENFKKVEDNPKEREALQRVMLLRERLEQRARQPRFFGESGVKIDDLIDFKIWLAEADRLKIELTDEKVAELTQLELVLGNYQFYDAQVYRDAYFDVRAHNARVSESLLRQVLRDEFRVLLAQRVLGHSGVRMALTPGQLWEFYREKRVEYKLALLPLFVEDFVKKVGEPNEVDLSSFFEKHKANPDDPTSEKIGFAIPTRVKVTWLSADATSDHFKKLSKLAVALQSLPPLPGPQFASWQALGASAGKLGAAATVFESVHNRFRMVGLREEGAALSIADYVSKNDASVAGAILGAGARLDGGFAVFPSYFSIGMLRHPKEFEAGVAADLKKRLQVYATLPLLGTMHQGIAHQGVLVPYVWESLPFGEYLPQPLIQQELLEIVERIQARRWVGEHMTALRKRLEAANIKTRADLERVLALYPKDMGLQIGELQGLGVEGEETKSAYHKYNIHEAKELEALKKSFLAYIDQVNIYEGRNAAPETMLKSNDFWKLFFSDSGEHFASAVRYQVKPWPPVARIQPQRAQQARLQPRNEIEFQIAQRAESAGPNEVIPIDLFKDAERPFLFWRTAEEPPLVPTKLDEVRDRVVEAWKFNRARENVVLERARDIAKKLQASNTPVLTMNDALDALKKEFDVKREIMPLGSAFEPVSPLVPVRRGGPGGGIQRIYTDFEIPAGLIPFPRKDTSAHLLSLYDLKEPIKIGYDPLDNINKALYDEISKEKDPRGKFVQILTNQPRTAFYVAAVRDAPAPSHADFMQAVLQAFGHDQLADRAQVEAGKRFREDLMRHLREIHEVEPPTDDIRKSFDSDAG